MFGQSSPTHLPVPHATRNNLQNTTAFPIEIASALVSSNSREGLTSWLPVGLTGVLIVCTWLANCILLGGALQTASSGRIVPVAYFFVGSQAIAALLHVTINLPPSVVNILFGTSNTQSYIHIFCLYSTYLDTLFCNLTFLQTFFSSLDAFLRLRNPVFYVASSRRRPALWLKVGSPWLVAGIQAIGQLALSDRHQVRLHTGSGMETSSPSLGPNLQSTCLLPDPNFLIIRTAIAYALPLITCLLLVGLQLRCLRKLRNYSKEAITALLQVRNSYGRRFPLHPAGGYAPISSTNIPSDKICNTLYKVDQGINTRLSSTMFRSPSEHIALIPLTLSANPHGPQHFPQSMSGSWHVDVQPTLHNATSTAVDPLIQVVSRSERPMIVRENQPLHQVILSSHPMTLVEVRSGSSTTSGVSGVDDTSVFHCPAHGVINVPNTTQTNISAIEPRESSDHLNAMQNKPNRVTLDEHGGQLQPTENHNCKPANASLKLAKEQSNLVSLPTIQPMVSSNSMHSIGHVLPCDPHSTLLSRTAPELTNQDSIQPISGEDKHVEASSMPTWLSAYYGEQLVVAINLVSCIIAVGTWSPYILATLAHGLCQPVSMATPLHPTTVSYSFTPTIDPSLLNKHQANFMRRCLIQVTPDRIADFKWWAYASSGLLLPCLLFFLDLGLREGCWKALNYGEHSKAATTRGSRVNIAVLPNSTSPVEAYRCSNFKGNSSVGTVHEKTMTSQSNTNNPPWNKKTSTTDEP